ncbi:secondary thiamine-phosphate synthase enzyme YjbQ [Sphingomonas sp. ASV193]|uniref:secondary thiamine-phosphate synthase enzyme YjbQ n=1 Tax=Sphingomonas sp. ASV193 TaxID=3144405 RepID=UPI0032E8CC06
MQIASTLLTVTAPRQGLHDISRAVAQWLDGQSPRDGLLTIFCRHTSASLLIQENASPDAHRDLERWLARLAPEGSDYEHDLEGPDDMPAHLRAAVTATSLSIPLVGGRLALGTWQGIFLLEHRRRPSPRQIALQLIGQ